MRKVLAALQKAATTLAQNRGGTASTSEAVGAAWNAQAHSSCLNGAGGSIRHYWVDPRGYQHFQGRGNPWNPVTGLKGRLALGGAGVAFAAYYWSSREEVPYTHRKHAIMFVSRAHEQALGKAIFEGQKEEAAAAGKLLPEYHPYVKVVQRIGQRIAKVAADGVGGGSYSHMQGLNWEFAVIKSPMANAFVVPGGKVVVFSGLLDILASEAELGSVLAHEVSHVLARHQAERMSTLGMFTLINLIFRWVLGLPVPNAALYLGVFLPYSRRAEYEADEIGLRLMARACFDPAAAPSMLMKLNAEEKKQELVTGAHVPGFLRTHPLTTARVEEVSKQLPEAYKLYEDSGCVVQRNLFERAFNLK